MSIENKQPNPNAQSQNEKEAFQNQEMVRYDDGALNLRFAKPGDRIAWEEHKSARPMTDQSSRALIRTSSGNEYLVGDGVVINTGAGTYARIWGDNPAKLDDVVIGRPWNVANFHTRGVESVELQYKVNAPESSSTTEVKGQNPFDKYNSLLEVVVDHAYPDEK